MSKGYELVNDDGTISHADGIASNNSATKGQMDTGLAGKVPTSRTVNTKALTVDITLNKSDVGLGNVDNTSDVNKPVSTAQAASIATKLTIPAGATSQYVRGDGTLASFPSIPSGQVNTDWNASSGVAQLLNKPTTLAGYGIIDAYPLSGNPSNFLTAITNAQVLAALAFTPYNSTNPSSFVTAAGARTARVDRPARMERLDTDSSSMCRYRSVSARCRRRLRSADRTGVRRTFP